MSDREQGKQLPESITIGQFEFSSVNINNTGLKEDTEKLRNHIYLQSIEIHTEKGAIPLVLQNDPKLPESSIVIEKSNSEESKQHFLKELEKQMKEASSCSVDTTNCPEPPKSLSDLAKYRNIGEKGNNEINPQLDIHDGTTIQILDTVSKLPPAYRHSLLGYLKSVEEEYDKSLHKSS